MRVAGVVWLGLRLGGDGGEGDHSGGSRSVYRRRGRGRGRRGEPPQSACNAGLFQLSTGGTANRVRRAGFQTRPLQKIAGGIRRGEALTRPCLRQAPHVRRGRMRRPLRTITACAASARGSFGNDDKNCRPIWYSGQRVTRKRPLGSANSYVFHHPLGMPTVVIR